LNFVSISITGPSQYFAQQIINSDQYRGFSFPMSNFTLSCTQQNDEQSTGPLFCPTTPTTPTLSSFNISSKTYGDPPFQITPPTSDSEGAFIYSSSNTSVATVSGSTIIIVGAGSSVITATQMPDGNYGLANISTQLIVNSIAPAFTTTNQTSATSNVYLFGMFFHGANMTPYFDESGLVSANITNDTGGVISPFLSVSSGNTYTTSPLYSGLVVGNFYTFTLNVTYTSIPPITKTLTFEYIAR
jgi:hypothetical protein